MPADLPAFETFGLPIVEDACEALGARHADGTAVGARGHSAVFGFYANKQLTTGEGGMIALGDPALKARIDSERNQGRAPDMGWLDHDRLGFNYRMTDLQAAIGIAQVARLDGMLDDRAQVAPLVRARRWAASTASGCRRPSTRATCAAGSSTSCRSRRTGPTATTVIDGLRDARRLAASPTCRRST